MNATPATAREHADFKLNDWPELQPAEASASCGCDVNVSMIERVGSLMAGSIITMVGLSHAQRGRLAMRNNEVVHGHE